MKKVVVKSFVDQFVALVQGDDAAAKAAKAKRQAIQALTAKIAAMEGENIDKEDAVEVAETYLADAMVNHGNDISSRTDYVTKLVDAKNRFTIAQEAKESHDKVIAFLKETLETISKEA